MGVTLTGFSDRALRARLFTLGGWYAVALARPWDAHRAAVLRRLRGLQRNVLRECGRRARHGRADYHAAREEEIGRW